MQTPTQLRRSPRRAGLAAKAQRGMTLIEIMVVVAIISLIMGGVGIMAFNRYQDAQKQDTKNQTISIQQAVEQYRTSKRGKCPKTLEDLKAAGFINRVAKDAWGNEFQFKCPGERTSIDVMSPGEDGEMGTADDITNFGDDEEAAADK